MFKNVASQKLIVFAFDTTTNVAKTGDAANLTAYVSKDYGAVTVLGDTSATEMDSANAKGYYLFDLTQGETNADCLLFSAKSSTGNIAVVGVPATIYTTPANFTAQSIDSNGRVDVIKVAGTTQTANDIGAAVPNATAGASGGLIINGSNSGTVTLAAMTVTGALTVSDGIAVTCSTSNRSAISATGNGTGSGLAPTGGATGHGVLSSGGATSGDGIRATGNVLGFGANFIGAGSNKHGVLSTGGSGSAAGIAAIATAGNGILATGAGAPGVAISATGNTINGMTITGSAASGAQPAGNGLQLTGGPASTTGGGVAGVGLKAIGGAGAATTNGAGDGMLATGGGTTTVAGGIGLNATGTAALPGISVSGGATGVAMRLVGGATSGDGLSVTTTSGHGVNIAVAGASKHGIFSTGGDSGTSDGIKAVAGSGGVPIRGDITGNITGNVTGSVGSVTGLTASDVGAIKTKTDSLAFTVAGQVDANIQYVNDVLVNGVGTSGSPWGP